MNGLAHAAAWESLVRARVAHVFVFFLSRADAEHGVVSDDSADFKAYATSVAIYIIISTVNTQHQ